MVDIFKKTLFFKILILTILLIIVNYLNQTNVLSKRIKILEKQLKDLGLIQKRENFSNGPPSVNIIPLSEPLEPKEIYDSIQCRISEEIIVKTTLCVHDLSKDVFVSKTIWTSGVWERDMVKTFTDILKANPEFLVFDVGAQI
ncbi:unnamed protein product, partial [Brachionus calyciflorus]